MFPEICSIGPFTVYSYGLMLVIGFVVAAWLACQQAKRLGLDPDTIFNLAFIAFVSGVAGARMFYVLDNLGYYLAHPVEIIMLQRGGLAWFGGLILGTISAVVYIKVKRLSVYRTLDLIVPFVALAQAIGRIGCLLNGCCFGKHADVGMYFPAHQEILIPTQLYSTLLLVVIYIILRFLQDAPHRDGQVFYVYLLLYAVKRFFIEFLRGDSPVAMFGLTLFQLLSIAVFLISAVSLTIIYKAKK
jgi:phosphatidylglycerol:prolipoprotein diacylglycerol transferase